MNELFKNQFLLSECNELATLNCCDIELCSCSKINFRARMVPYVDLATNDSI